MLKASELNKAHFSLQQDQEIYIDVQLFLQHGAYLRTCTVYVPEGFEGPWYRMEDDTCRVIDCVEVLDAGPLPSDEPVVEDPVVAESDIAVIAPEDVLAAAADAIFNPEDIPAPAEVPAKKPSRRKKST